MANLARIFIGSGAAFLLSQSAFSVNVYDFASDFSSVNNPNAPWSYIEKYWSNGAEVPMTFATSWPYDAYDASQTFWRGSGPSVLFKYIGGSPNNYDWQVGDVITHAPNDGSANIFRFTAPKSGIVNITGQIWQIADAHRYDYWMIAKDSQYLTGGTINSGVTSRANPFDFAAGALGPGALSNITLKKGQNLDLYFYAGNVEWYAGFNYTVKYVNQSTPSPSAILIPLLSAVGVAVRRRKKSRA